MTGTSEYQDLLRLSVPERQELLNELERREISRSERQMRRYDRHPYHVWDGLLIRLKPPEGEWAGFRVTPRNISSGGLSFLHGSFVYPGSRCVAMLRTLQGEHVVAQGQVVRCRVVRGRAYEISVAFDTQIDIEKFVHVDTPQAASMALPYDYREVDFLAQQLQQMARRGDAPEKLRKLLAELGRAVRKRRPNAGAADPQAEAKKRSPKVAPAAAASERPN